MVVHCLPRVDQRLVAFGQNCSPGFPEELLQPLRDLAEIPTLEYPLTVSSLSASSSGRPDDLEDRLLGGPDRLLPVGKDHPSPTLGGRQQLLVGHDPVSPAPAGTLPPRKPPAPSGSDRERCPPCDGDETDDSPVALVQPLTHLKHPEPGLLRGNADVARESQFETSPDRETVDGGDDRFRDPVLPPGDSAPESPLPRSSERRGMVACSHLGMNDFRSAPAQKPSRHRL